MGDNDQVAQIKGWAGGLNTQTHPLEVPEGQIPEIMNWDVDDGVISKRLGFVQYNSTVLPGSNIPFSGKEFELSNGTKMTVVQANQTGQITGPSTETRSLFYYETGTAAYRVVQGYATGTADFTNASATITGIGTQFLANLTGTVTNYWIGRTAARASADPTVWYKVASVASATSLTLDTAYAFGSDHLGSEFLIVQVFTASTEAYFEQYKDNLLIFQSGSRPMRFNGTIAYPVGNLVPSTATTFTPNGAGSCVDGDHFFRVVYNYSTWGRSEPTAVSAAVTVTAANSSIDVAAVPRGSAAVTSAEVYMTKAVAVGSPDPGVYYLAVTITNGTATGTISMTDDTLGGNAVLERDLGKIDLGRTVPVNGKYTKVLDERLWSVDSANNPSLLTGSKPQYPAENPTANTIVVATEDGQVITGLSESYGKLVIFKEDSMYYLPTNNLESALVKIPTDIGCLSHKTICKWRNKLVWLSRKGVAMGDIQGAEIISNSVNNELLAVKQAVIKAASNLLTSKIDWDTGTHQSGSATQSATSATSDGSVQLVNVSPNPVNDTAYADWTAAGTSLASGPALNVTEDRNVTGFTNRGSLYLAQVTTATPSMIRPVSYSGVDGSASGFTNSSNAIDNSTTTYATSGAMTAARSLTINLLSGRWRCNKVQLRFTVFESSTSTEASVTNKIVTFAQKQVDRMTATFTPMDNGSSVGISYAITVRNAGVTETVLATTPWGTMGGTTANVTVRVQTMGIFESGFVAASEPDDPAGTGNGTYAFISKIFDMGAANTTPGLGTFTATWGTSYFDSVPSAVTSVPDGESASGAGTSAATAQMLFDVATGTDDPGGTAAGTTNWSAWLPCAGGVSGGAQFTATKSGSFRRYVQYRGRFRTVGGATPAHRASVTPRLDSVTLTMKTAATYTGPVVDASANNVRWGKFLYDSNLAGGSIQAQERHGALSPPTDGAYVNISSGDLVTGSATRYIQYTFLLTPATTPAGNATDSPLVDSAKVEWANSSSLSAKYPAAARVYTDPAGHEKYYLAVETNQSSVTANDRVYVLNRQGAWTRYDWGVNDFMVSAGVFLGLSASTTTPYSARVLRLLYGYSDDGSIVVAYFKTRPYVKDARIKVFKRLWVLSDVAELTATAANAIDIVVGQDSYTVNNAILAIDAAYAANRLTHGWSLGAMGTGIMSGFSGANALIQSGTSGLDYHFNYRGHWIQLEVYSQGLNTSPIRIHEFTVAYIPKKLRGTG